MDVARTARVLADILYDASRMTPEQVRDIVDDAALYGAADDTAETAVGNYIAYQASVAGITGLSTIYFGPRLYVLDAATTTIVATLDTTGTLHELHQLIEDAEPGFEHLHHPLHPLGAADLAEMVGAAPITPDEADYFARITAEMMSDFA